ncbi:MAG: hypothetical protein KDC92_03905 [Bacteroidetes bacterium]|nr:hypothetical protein [Bacteroidota bacterium]
MLSGYPTSVVMLFYGTTLLALVFFLNFLKIGINNLEWDVAEKAQFLRKIMLTLFGWLFVTCLASLTGIIAKFDAMPPRPVFVLGAGIILIVVLLSSKKFNQVILAVPPHFALWFQVFRVPVEIFLWMMFTKEFIPIEMTFEGLNFDILAGILGPIVGYLVFQKKALPKAVATIYHVLGLATLITIVTIAVLSMPTPIQQFTPSNTFVVAFPFIWLPTILVPLAATFHIIGLKQLRSN